MLRELLAHVGCALPVQEHPAPDLEVDEHHREVRVILPIRIVGGENGLDGWPPEHASTLDGGTAEEGVPERQKLPFEPRADRRAEAPLAAPEHPLRHDAVESLLEQPFELTA